MDPRSFSCARWNVRRWVIGLVALGALLTAATLRPPAARAATELHQDVTVAVLSDSPPFSYQSPNGTWEGLAVEMWNLVADNLHLDTHFEGMNREALTAAVAAGRARFGIGAFAITTDRLKHLDFSAPFEVTGVAIAVPYVSRSIGGTLLDALLSTTFLNLVLGLAALLAVVGTVFWMVERHRNPDFAGRRVHGWGSGIWLSIVTMTTVGYGDKAPRTLSGRVVAALWMFISIALISIFTGTVTTLLTVARVGTRIEGAEDLDRVRVVCVAESAAAQLLADRHIHCQQVPDLAQGFAALRNGRADALVHDRALIGWALKQEPDLPIKLLPGTLRPEYYAFAMAPNEPLRRRINEAIAHALDDVRWSQFRFAYLGNQAERH